MLATNPKRAREHGSKGINVLHTHKRKFLVGGGKLQDESANPCG